MKKVLRLLDAIASEVVGIRSELHDFKTEMTEFRSETARSFERVDRRLGHIES